MIPKWIYKQDLDLYFGVMKTGKFPKFDWSVIKRLISICDYFKNFDLMNTLINEIIIPNLDKFTCLKILKDYLEKLDNEDTKQYYTEIIQKCFEISAKNIFYLVNNHQNELAMLKDDSLEEIIERFIIILI